MYWLEWEWWARATVGGLKWDAMGPRRTSAASTLRRGKPYATSSPADIGQVSHDTARDAVRLRWLWSVSNNVVPEVRVAKWLPCRWAAAAADVES